MRKLLFGILLFLSTVFGINQLAHFSPPVLAVTLENCEREAGKGTLSPSDLKECDRLLDETLQGLADESRTLESEIKRFNTIIAMTTNKIVITEKDIENLEKEIADLTAKITRLDVSLDQVSEILIRRINQTYKKGKIRPLSIFLSAGDFADFLSRYRYLQIAQLHDRKVMIEMETVRISYDDQKKLKEKKQSELAAAKEKLESQKFLLNQQKADKEKLLVVSQNNTLKYQQILAVTRAELEAIQKIIAGQGEEREIGRVNQGEAIARIIAGPSACSTGTHLHFQITEDNNIRNPFAYLKNINLEDASGGDPHTGTGDWDWPLNEPIKLTQGFGENTSAIRSRVVSYDFHTGIDIVSNDLIVKAVKNGTLYQGSIPCGNGYLQYVRVRHENSSFDTYYLHVYY